MEICPAICPEKAEHRLDAETEAVLFTESCQSRHVCMDLRLRESIARG